MENATLEIQNGDVKNIFGSYFAGVMSVSNANVDISKCTFKNTHGTHAGVAVISRSSFDVSGSYFEGILIAVETAVTFALLRQLWNRRVSRVLRE